MPRCWRSGHARLAGLAVAALMIVAAGAAGAAPKPDLWPRWTAHDPGSDAVIDHLPWDRFLAKYLVAGEDGVNRLRYGRVTAADRAALKGYVATLAAVPIRPSGAPSSSPIGSIFTTR